MERPHPLGVWVSGWDSTVGPLKEPCPVHPMLVRRCTPCDCICQQSRAILASRAHGRTGTDPQLHWCSRTHSIPAENVTCEQRENLYCFYGALTVSTICHQHDWYQILITFTFNKTASHVPKWYRQT